jgi:hypothetical protein
MNLIKVYYMHACKKSQWNPSINLGQKLKKKKKEN